MAKAIREATVEEYLDLVEKGDHDGFITFVAECFGSDEDFDGKAADAFAEEALPALNQKVKEAMDNVTEATPEIMEAAQKTAEQAAEVKKEEVAKDAGTDEAKVEASEATEEK